MSKRIITEIDLRNAFKAGRTLGAHNSYMDAPLTEEEWIHEFFNPTIEPEKTYPVTFFSIVNSCGWSEFCDVTGGNHYAVKEFGIEDREIFDVKESHAKRLGLI